MREAMSSMSEIKWKKTEYVFRYDRDRRRVWIARQRVHHGPVGLIAVLLGIALVLHDWKDRTIWFVRGIGELN